jgi:hypothetical protein
MENGSVPGFDMFYSSHRTEPYYEELMATRGKEFEQALILWLQEEHRLGRLFEQKRWKGFHAPDDYSDVEVRYQRLFVHDGYYFEVVIECREPRCEEHGLYPVDFRLNLYGWDNSDQRILLEHDGSDVEADQMMPAERWAQGKDREWYEADDAREEAIEKRIKKRPHWQSFKKKRTEVRPDTDRI